MHSYTKALKGNFMFWFADFSVEQNAQLIFSGQGSEIICVNVALTDDGVYEGDESHCIALQSSDPDITIGPIRETCITIVDNDCKLSVSTHYGINCFAFHVLFLVISAITVGFQSSHYTISEGSGVSVCVEIFNGTSSGPVRVTVGTAEGTANGMYG